MEKTRTLYRFRRMKNSVLLNLFTLTLGIILFSVIFSFEKDVKILLRDKATDVLVCGQNENINSALQTCDKAFGYLMTASLVSILFSMEGFIFIFFFVRLSSKTSKLSTFSPLFMGFGNLLFFIFYFLAAILLPSIGQAVNLPTGYNVVKIIGIALILFANILFVGELFKQIVLEKGEE